MLAIKRPEIPRCHRRDASVVMPPPPERVLIKRLLDEIPSRKNKNFPPEKSRIFDALVIKELSCD
jgi:hypothetical protein